MEKRFKEMVDNRTAVVGIIGLGYVGLPLALRFVESGFRVIGYDLDPAKARQLKDGESYIEHIPAATVKAALKNGLDATSNVARLSKTDALLICVPTPLNKYREPDLSFVVDTVQSLIPYLKRGQLIALESTTYPGTTDEVIKPGLEKSGLKVGEDLFLVYSPEREDPGNKTYSTKNIPKLVGGYSAKCKSSGMSLYSAIIDKVVPMTSTKAAEMTKLLENIHRAVNIGLANEMKIVADRMDIDIHEVIDAAATKPFGFTPYYPGPGLGGHCIPIDPFYLTWKAREFGIHTRFIELAGEINSSMPEYVVTKTIEALNSMGKPLKSSDILVLGIAYKKNVDDMRESPSTVIMEKLRDYGASVSYSDPHVPIFPKMREHYFELSSIELTPESLAKFDCTILATDHDQFDYALIHQNSKLVIDTRGVYREPHPNVVKA